MSLYCILVDYDKRIEGSKIERRSNHIEEYFKQTENTQGRLSRDLFDVGEHNEHIDFKTDLSLDEIKDISSLHFNDNVLQSLGFPRLFEAYYIKFMRLVISKERKSRGEFVSINKQSDSDETLNKLSNLDALRGSKQ